MNSQLPQVPIEGYCTIVAVDVEGMLEARNGWELELATGCQDQSIIGEYRICCGLILDGNDPSRSIDGTGRCFNEGNACWLQCRSQRHAQGLGCALIEPRPDCEVRSG